MTKNTQPMYYCEKCKEYVPDKDKHDQKRHPKKEK